MPWELKGSCSQFHMGDESREPGGTELAVKGGVGTGWKVTPGRVPLSRGAEAGECVVIFCFLQMCVCVCKSNRVKVGEVVGVRPWLTPHIWMSS